MLLLFAFLHQTNTKIQFFPFSNFFGKCCFLLLELSLKVTQTELLQSKKAPILYIHYLVSVELENCYIDLRAKKLENCAFCLF